MAKVLDMNPKEPTVPMIVGAEPIWYPEKPVRPDRLRQDIGTLTFLLEEDNAREQVCGPGDWALNEMTDEVEYGKKALTPVSYTRMRVELERIRSDDGRPLKFSDSEVRAVARMLAQRHSYSPVCDYLNGLSYQGGDAMAGLNKALGLDEQTQGLEMEFVRRWLIAAVARAFEPGCQVDTVLVLQGSEGQFKSRFFEEIGGKWFVRMSAELGSKDSIETMRRGWIIELDELDAVKRTKEFSTVKAAITRPYDDYVPKWIRESQKVWRRSVLGGTVNDVECLVDEDGLRRFWIAAIRRRIDRYWVREHRDEIWAQAVAWYRMKAQWHLTPEQEELQREQVTQFIQRHPWTELIENYLAERPFDDFTTSQELYSKALGELAPAQQNSGTHRTLANVLRGLGWQRFVQGSGHTRVRGWKRQVVREG